MFPRVLLLLAVTPLYAQFSQFAATDDGSQVYFVSPLVLFGSPTTQDSELRLYRLGADGVKLIAQEQTVRNPFAFSSGSDGISDPQVSGDGTLIGYTLQNVCDSTGACGPETQLQYGAQTKPLGPGTLQLSRNGQWALVTSLNATPAATLIDPVTNFAAQVPQPRFTSFRTLASDGSVLVQNGIWKQGQVTAIPFPIGLAYNPLALSDNAAVIVSYAFVPGPAAPTTGQLIATNIATGQPTTLYRFTSTNDPVFMALSNDGSRALYRVAPLASTAGVAYVADTASGQSTAIALPTGELVIDGTLDGNGDIAILVTTLGRIVKVTLATGAIEPLIPPTPYLSNINNLSIGSLVHLQTFYPGTAADWTGQIMLGGEPLPIVGVKPGEVDVQISWEQASGEQQLQINLQDGSPFQQFQSVFVSPIAPAFEFLESGQSAIFPIKIVKGDWSGYQTTQPQAGDIVYIYMTGLGPVVNPVQTGVPASLTAPDPIQGTLTCTFSPQTTPAMTLFAGLAPGTIGVYQTAFRIPSDPNTKPFSGINCNLDGTTSFGFEIIGALIGVP